VINLAKSKPQEGPLLRLVRKERRARATSSPAAPAVKGLDWHERMQLPPPGPRRRTLFELIGSVLSGSSTATPQRR